MSDTGLEIQCQIPVVNKTGEQGIRQVVSHCNGQFYLSLIYIML